jgi:hypothetical protein
MGKTVEQLLRELSSAELAEWIALDGIEPVGARRDDIHAGMIAATVANVNRKEGSKPVGPDFFFGWLKPKKEVETPQSLAARLKAQFAGRIIKKPKSG